MHRLPRLPGERTQAPAPQELPPELPVRPDVLPALQGAGNAALARLLQRKPAGTIQEEELQPEERKELPAGDYDTRKRLEEVRWREERRYHPDGKEKKDPLDQLIEETIGDPKKRAEALAEYKVADLTTPDPHDTPEEMLLDDVQSGIETALHYVGFVQQATDYYLKYGKYLGSTGVQQLDDAIEQVAGDLKFISDSVGDRLKGITGVISKVQDAIAWFKALGGVADATKQMHFGPTKADRDSVKRWVTAVERLRDTTAPFAEAARVEAVGATLEAGEEGVIATRAAGTFAAEMAIVGSLVYVGLKTLEVGVANVSAYIDKEQDAIAEIDRLAGAGPELPPPPIYPGPWAPRTKHRGITLADQNVMIEERMRGTQARREEHAIEDFQTKLFPKLYRRNRGEIMRKIRTALKKAHARGRKGVKQERLDEPVRIQRQPEWDWWECLAAGEGYGNDPDWEETDPDVGRRFPRKMHVTPQEAEDEIRAFKRVGDCTFFNDLYEKELRKHVDKTASLSGLKR